MHQIGFRILPRVETDLALVALFAGLLIIRQDTSPAKNPLRR